ncbi:RluA family pseudouridine synthase [Amphibiibacter pelophylacis]|uniref:RluA family pseudouridine synthase n=1 Tax=Amphibiibacter pelophylacis TaxID=1799477 RepID=A0ACC6NZP9_9BURK
MAPADPAQPVDALLEQTAASPVLDQLGGIDLLALDDDWVVAVKPAGLLSVPGRDPGQDHLLRRLAPLSGPPGSDSGGPLLVVHRLDQATSGLIVLARHKAAQADLARQFQQREVAKRYEAVVLGQPDPPHGQVDKALLVDWPNRPRQQVNVHWGKPALTLYRSLAPWPLAQAPATRVALWPVTGRSHQLRVHMQWINHPILGDEFYAPPAWQPGGSTAAPDRLLLHASHLALKHPSHGGRATWHSPAPF